MRSALDYEAYIFDLDGTVYLGQELIPGADTAIQSLRQSGRKTMFISNKPIETRAAYAEKLTRLGIPTSEEWVLNSSLALARYLSRDMPCARTYVIGETPLIEDLIVAGLQIVSDPLEAEVVVLSWDRDFGYRKLSDALTAALNGARLVATNPDVSCPVAGGGYLPDCGAIAAAVEACSGRKVELFAGKPHRLLADIALQCLEVRADQCLMVGDRPETDIVFGHNAGMGTALVLTGAGRLTSLSQAPMQPDFVLQSIAELTVEEPSSLI